MPSPDNHHPSGIAAARPEQVVQYLLAHNYLLTALELLVEAQEAGKEEDVESLQRYFSDSAKFPAEAVAQCNPHNAVNIQQLARQREERLGIVEYELRVAQEDLAESKASSKQGAATVSADMHENGYSNSLGAEVDVTDSPADLQSRPDALISGPNEQRMLNAAVRAYLVSQGYKLTALTLSEEGGNSVPAALPQNCQSLTELLHSSAQRTAALEAQQAAEALQQEAQEQAEAADARVTSLQEALDVMTKEKARLKADMEFLQRQLDLVAQQAEQAAAARSPEKPLKGIGSSSDEQQDLDGTGPALLGAEAALRVVAEQLPKIVPNMLINKRDEVLPVFLAVIQEHRDSATRDKLTHALFNLVKKPTAAQRHLIADGCADLAGRIGPSRTAEELLPQCWEQVNHRHAERRALVAETCGALAPYVTADMRPSLVLSILQQMATDSDALVRQAVVHSLTHLLPLLMNLDKFQAVQLLLLQLVKDPSQDVVDAAFEHLLPAVLRWMSDVSLLYTSLLPAVLTDIRAMVDRCPLLAGTAKSLLQSGRAELRAVSDQQQRQVQVLLRLYTNLLPHLRQVALQQRPGWALVTAEEASCGFEGDLELEATIKQESAAVLNIGHAFHSEDDEVSGTHAAVLPPASAPDSPRSSTLDLSTRLSTGHSTADGDDADDTSGPQAAPASSNSSLTQGNLAVIAASSKSMAQQPSASVSSQAGSFSTTGQQQRTEQAQPSPASVRGTALPSDALATAPNSSIAGQAPQSPGGRTKRSAASAVQSQTNANSDSIPQQRQQADGLSAIPQGVDGTSRTLLQQPSIGRSAADAAFATWVTAEGHAEWAAVDYLGTQALPGLIMALRMVAPHTDTEALRRRFSAAVKATCLSFGADFATGLVQPLFAASAALPHDSAAPDPPAHIIQLLTKLGCRHTEAQRVGRLTVLPVLLSGVLPYAQLSGQSSGQVLQEILLSSLQGRQLTDAAGTAPAWAAQHATEVAAAVKFAAPFHEVQAPLTYAMQALQPHAEPAVRRCAVACACALVPCVPRHQVMRKVLPTLQHLSEDSSIEVQAAAIEGLVQLLPVHASNNDLAARLYAHLDELVTSNQPQVQLAVLGSLTTHVAQFGEGAMEFLLQKVLMVLTYVHRRAPGSLPAQFQDLAHACFVALRAADSCEVSNETVQLHLVAAMQSLHREGELLPASQKEVLSAMLREHGATALSHAPDAAQASQQRRISSSGRNGSTGHLTASNQGRPGSTGHLTASNQGTPDVPRHTVHLTKRTSDLGPSISGGQQTPNRSNLGASLLRRFNSGTTQEQPRRSIFGSGAGQGSPQDSPGNYNRPAPH